MFSRKKLLYIILFFKANVFCDWGIFICSCFSLKYCAYLTVLQDRLFYVGIGLVYKVDMLFRLVGFYDIFCLLSDALSSVTSYFPLVKPKVISFQLMFITDSLNSFNASTNCNKFASHQYDNSRSFTFSFQLRPEQALYIRRVSECIMFPLFIIFWRSSS